VCVCVCVCDVVSRTDFEVSVTVDRLAAPFSASNTSITFTPGIVEGRATACKLS
jgi:hypothetical protein